MHNALALADVLCFVRPTNSCPTRLVSTLNHRLQLGHIWSLQLWQIKLSRPGTDNGSSYQLTPVSSGRLTEALHTYTKRGAEKSTRRRGPMINMRRRENNEETETFEAGEIKAQVKAMSWSEIKEVKEEGHERNTKYKRREKNGNEIRARGEQRR